MYKKPTQVPSRKPTVGQNSLKRQKTTIDKKYQTNASEFKSKDQKITFLIKEYLLQNGYGRSYESLKRQKPVKKLVVTNNLINKPNDHSRDIITAFQKGQRQLFFKLTSKLFAKNDEALIKFECQLQVYFYIYAVHPNIKKATSVDKNSMEALKRYLDQKGTQLSKNDQLLPYFMLPFMPKPQQKLQNQKIAKIFKKQWINKLKQKLTHQIKHINQSGDIPPKTGRKVSQLEQIYNKYVEDQSQNTKQNFNHLQMESKIQQLNLHNKELLSYISKLENSFAELGESSKLHIIQSNRKWFNFAKQLLLEVKKASKGQKVQCLQKYEGFFGKSLDQLINGADISLFQRGSFIGDQRSFIPEGNKINQSNLPKKQDACGFQIDMIKIQTLFANADNLQKQIPICLVLKALKNRFTKLNNQYLKRQIIVQYSRHDICGATPQKYYIQKKLLIEGSQKIRQFYLRLAYAITNDIYGIQYLSKCDKLIQNLINFLKKGQQNGDNKNLMFGILQKFSYVKRSCLKMIQLGIIPLILQIFIKSMEGDIQLQSFTIQFLTATIMNLSMKKQSKSDFTKYKKQFMQILISLIQFQSQQIKNYANGSIYLLLNFQQIKKQAIRQNLAQKITEICQTYKSQDLQQDNFYNQYNYILERLQKDEQALEEQSDDQQEEVIEMDEFQKQDEEEQNWEEEQSNQYIEGQQQYMSGQEYLMKEFMLLGPEAVKEQILNRSVLDETSKKVNNMTMSINHSRRMDNIFNQRPGTPTLQPELDKLLHGDDKKQNKQSKILKKI